MHKHKKYTNDVKLYGAIGFPVVDKIENPLLKNLGAIKPLWLFKDVKPWFLGTSASFWQLKVWIFFTCPVGLAFWKTYMSDMSQHLPRAVRQWLMSDPDYRQWNLTLQILSWGTLIHAIWKSLSPLLNNTSLQARDADLPASPAGLLGRFAPSGFALRARISLASLARV